jgi:hypothetical protein
MAQDPPSTGAGGIRIGHRERDAVAAVLQEAAADGRLSMAELDERLDVALQAKTHADLDPLVADLSVELPSQQNGVQSQAQRPRSVGYSREDPLRLDGGVSSEKRRGVWTKSWRSKKVKVPRDPAPGKPLLVIYGSLGMGSLKVRPPNSLHQRRIAGTDHDA